MNAPSAVTHKVEARPAESAGLAGSVVVLIAYGFGLTDPSVIVALTVIVGAVPAVVTWLVTTFRKPREGV